MDRHDFKSVDKHLTWLLRHILQTRDGWVIEDKIINHSSCISKGYDKKILGVWRQDQGQQKEARIRSKVVGGKVFYKAVAGHSEGNMCDEEAFDKVCSNDVPDVMYFVTWDTKWASINKSGLMPGRLVADNRAKRKHVHIGDAEVAKARLRQNKGNMVIEVATKKLLKKCHNLFWATKSDEGKSIILSSDTIPSCYLHRLSSHDFGKGRRQHRPDASGGRRKHKRRRDRSLSKRPTQTAARKE